MHGGILVNEWKINPGLGFLAFFLSWVFWVFFNILKLGCNVCCFWLAFLHHMLWKQWIALFKEIQSSPPCVFIPLLLCLLWWWGKKKGWGGGGCGDSSGGSDVIWGTPVSLEESATLQWRSRWVGNEEGSCWVALSSLGGNVLEVDKLNHFWEFQVSCSYDSWHSI